MLGVPLQEAHVSQALQPGMRVTLHMGASPDNQTLDDGSEVLNAQVVSPDEPRRSSGLYWGATTRIARGISAVFSECPYEVRTMPLMQCACVAAYRNIPGKYLIDATIQYRKYIGMHIISISVMILTNCNERRE